MGNSSKAKPFWLSKTFWVNIIAIIFMMVQYFTKWVADAGTQALILGVINLVLRLVTKQPVNWGGDKSGAGG